MSTWNTTREGLQAAAQKANDAYAVARKAQEQVSGLTERISILEEENALLWARLRETQAIPVETPKRRKAA